MRVAVRAPARTGLNYPAMIGPKPPAHLSQTSREFWRTTVERYELQAHHLKLLQLACEAWDRAQRRANSWTRRGLTVPGAKGYVRPHPCVVIERDSRLAVARLVRELDLDTPPPVGARLGPPAIFSNRGVRRARETVDN